jgi:cell cycle checkpoint protein
VDKYAPTTAAQLCVAPKKVKEVRTWLLDTEKLSRLLVFVGSPGVGKSTVIQILGQELGWTVNEWSDSYTSRNYSRSGGGGGGSLASVDQSNSLESFQEFLDHAGAGFSPLELSMETTKMTNNSEGKSIILIDELPNLYNAEVEEEFREIMTRHLQLSNTPTVLIFSDVREGKHQPRDLERLIDPQFLYSNLVKILQCNPVTKARMKKSLEQISKKEGIQVPPQFWEEVHLQSGGDLRHAIMSLQFRGNNNDAAKNKKGNFERDAGLSMFHALGKALYAKRQQHMPAQVSESSNDRPPLDFNPDIVMEQSGMELGGALTFLEYHSPDFFSDVSELSSAFDDYSDAALLLDRSMQRDYSDPTFPGGYVGSIAGRAVATANRHPAPRSFRPLSAPKIFEVIRNQRANEVTMNQLCKRLSVGSERIMPLDSNLGGSSTFVADRLPFMRTIIPGEVNSAMNSLFSHVRSNENRESNVESENALRIKEQAKILEMDDIVEDDSSSEDESFVQLSSRNESAAKRLKMEPPKRKAPREVSLSPQEVILIDE